MLNVASSITTVFAFAAMVVAGAAGCSEVDERFDCAQICSRYSDCFDADYDVDTCRNRCESKADTEAGFADKADACENCLDDRSCSGSFACTSECIGIVP
jgi:hypothetical protein